MVTVSLADYAAQKIESSVVAVLSSEREQCSECDGDTEAGDAVIARVVIRIFWVIGTWVVSIGRVVGICWVVIDWLPLDHGYGRRGGVGVGDTDANDEFDDAESITPSPASGPETSGSSRTPSFARNGMRSLICAVPVISPALMDWPKNATSSSRVWVPFTPSCDRV